MLVASHAGTRLPIAAIIQGSGRSPSACRASARNCPEPGQGVFPPCLVLRQTKTGDPLRASCKKSPVMTSYGGIIRIRLKGRRSIPSSQPASQAPLYLVRDCILHPLRANCKGASDQDAVAMVDLMLDDLGRPAGKGADARLAVGSFVLHLDAFPAPGGAHTLQRKTALLGVVGAGLFEDDRVEPCPRSRRRGRSGSPVGRGRCRRLPGWPGRTSGLKTGGRVQWAGS